MLQGVHDGTKKEARKEGQKEAKIANREVMCIQEGMGTHVYKHQVL